MKFVHSATHAFLVFLMLLGAPTVVAKNKGKKGKSRSGNERNGSAGKNKGKKLDYRRSFVASPTYSPALDAAITPPTSEAPTFSPVLQTETRRPTFNVPGTSTWYSFTTAPAEMPVMNAATDAPHLVDDCEPTTVPILDAATVSPSPTIARTLTPTVYPSKTEYTDGGYYNFTTGPVPAPTLNAQTATPTSPNTTDELGVSPSLSPVSILDTATSVPSSNTSIGTNTSGTNETALCTSSSGSFFLPGEDNSTDPFELDVFTFAYELETLPRISASDVLPSLEVAFVNSLLATLFPSQCRSSSMRFFMSETIVGISSEPGDEPTGAECQPQLSEKNRCEIIQGKLSIFSTDGDTATAMIEIEESLAESMNEGEFNDASSGVARVTYSTEEIPDDGTQEDNGINDNEENDVVKPGGESGSMLGIGLSLSAAGVLLIVVGASAYRRKKKVRDHDASTLQEGATLNGLSRFDEPNSDDSYTNGNREIKVMPQSPAVRSREIKVMPLSPASRGRVETFENDLARE